LAGIYGLIKRAMQATAGPGQKSPLDFMETAAETRLGMPLPSVLAVFSREFASFQTSPTFDPAKQVYIVGIRKRPEALKLLRTGLAERISDEHLEGDNSFLKISEGGHASAAGTASWKYYHAAVTPEEVVISKRYEAVRETVAAGKKASSENAMVPQSWRAAREQFPKNVNGLGFLDFQKIDWAAAKERWKAESDQASRRAAAKQEIQPDAFTKALKDLDPQVFPRHLHLAASGSWKDAQGVHFDGWID